MQMEKHVKPNVQVNMILAMTLAIAASHCPAQQPSFPTQERAAAFALEQIGRAHV